MQEEGCSARMLSPGLHETAKHLQKVRVFELDKTVPKSTANERLVYLAQH